ncbi:conserved exported hypothetical protein [Paraburkholderia ribeironis]|uniref:Lysozyme inhibitor LprI N-terminal domain-containing protein n=2 Tax=Paraburkholderia ribeironis TaxID=1247936 RepID=A0A1N7S9I7_9BURK|nr:conserved exported hypothetical protein [Paraburkholderia ribeironis]
MHRTRMQIVCLILCMFFSTLVAAKSTSDCLQHLGGGYGDAECYSGLQRSLVADSKRIYNKLRATIPNSNMHAKLLDEYMATQDASVKYCELPRNAGARWKTEHDGSMFPALQEECIYNLRKAQNKFLKDLLDMAKW